MVYRQTEKDRWRALSSQQMLEVKKQIKDLTSFTIRYGKNVILFIKCRPFTKTLHFNKKIGKL